MHVCLYVQMCVGRLCVHVGGLRLTYLSFWITVHLTYWGRVPGPGVWVSWTCQLVPRIFCLLYLPLYPSDFWQRFWGSEFGSQICVASTLHNQSSHQLQLHFFNIMFLIDYFFENFMYVYNSLVIFIPNSSPKLLPDPPPILLPSKVHSFKNVILKPLYNDFSFKMLFIVLNKELARLPSG